MFRDLDSRHNVTNVRNGSFADKNTATHLRLLSGVKRTKSSEKRTSRF
jgi:hypothetical protein